MQLHEITNIYEGDRLYESLMASDELLDENAKELFAAGKKKLGQAAERLKDAVDAPAQKAWAEIQSRLATAGKDDAIGKLKAFASKHKIAIGTLAIIGAGLLTTADASADALFQASGGDSIMGPIFQGALDNGADQQAFGNALSNLEINGLGAQEYAAKAEEAAQAANNYVERNNILKKAAETIKNALLDTIDKGDGQQTAQNVADGSRDTAGGSSQHVSTDIFGKKQTINFDKSYTDDLRRAGNIVKGKK